MIDHADQFGRQPPHDIEAEQATLGAMLISPQAAARAAQLVAREDFYRPAHQTVFDCIMAMRHAGKPVDATTVRVELHKAGAFLGQFQPTYLHDLMQACPAPASVAYYAQTVADLAGRRRALEHLIRADQRLRASDGDLVDVLGEVTRDLDIEQRLAYTDAPPWVSGLTEGDTFVLDVPATPPAVWGQGDTIGWAEGEALMLVGPPGVGKTTLVVQLVAARLGITKAVLGLPVQAGSRRVLYLAMDRPPQIARAMVRVFHQEHRHALAHGLTVWKGPPPADLARSPSLLTEMCLHADADTVIVDSLKDAVLRLSDDEAGSGYNRARQQALVAGVQVVELHHQRKANGDNKKPTKLDDVYGSAWLTAGAGSVIGLWGEAGDPIVQLTHLKQPMEPLGPWQIIHDHLTGRSEIYNSADVLQMVRRQGAAGLTPQALARSLFSTNNPSPSEVERARRKLDKYVTSGVLVRRSGQRGGGLHRSPSSYFLATKVSPGTVAG